MCLEVYIVPAKPNKVSAERLSRVSGLRIVTTADEKLHVSVDGGCSCSLMNDSADWNNPTWDFDSFVLPGIAEALRLLARDADGFTLQATWIGDRLESRAHVPLPDVVADVLANRIKNKHLYIVGNAKP